jgi:hypothetical protein
MPKIRSLPTDFLWLRCALLAALMTPATAQTPLPAPVHGH